MKTLFTLHAGEYLVDSEIEKKLEWVNIWLPSKDQGIDLLVENPKSQRIVSLQVKLSKHYHDPNFPMDLKAGGWWTPSSRKIRDSRADLWVFVFQFLMLLVGLTTPRPSMSSSQHES